MKRYTYPAVVYRDDDDIMYALSIDDLSLVTSGRTVEEAYERALVQLQAYIGNSIFFEQEIPDASEFKDVYRIKPKNVVLLVSERINEKGRG